MTWDPMMIERVRLKEQKGHPMSEDWQTTEEASTARRLLRSVDSGILSTMSRELPGYPFGSVTPYFLTHTGQVVIYVSTIAQHTKNMKADQRVCLTVMDRGVGNSQALGRATVVGDATIVSGDDAEQAERYFRLFPEAVNYGQTHDFYFFGITPLRVRYIGGFGKIYWVESNDWSSPVPEWSADESGIVDHMNKDHGDALKSIVRHTSSQTAEAVQMLAVDMEGFHVRADDTVLYIPFESPCLAKDSVRTAMVNLTKRSREES